MAKCIRSRHKWIEMWQVLPEKKLIETCLHCSVRRPLKQKANH